MQRDQLLMAEIIETSQRIIWQIDSNVLLSIAQDDVPRLLVGARLAHLEGGTIK